MLFCFWQWGLEVIYKKVVFVSCQYPIQSIFLSIFLHCINFIFHSYWVLFWRQSRGRWERWRYGNTLGRWHNVWDVSEMTWKFLWKNTQNIKPNNMTDRFKQWCKLAIHKVSSCLVCLIKCLCKIAGWQS